MSSAPTRTVNCPTCQRPVEFTPSSRHRPFCSQRCREIDLGAWASERYAIPASPPREDDLDDR
ncbi:MAG: DNA gyrase inhibitor YacG [Betaproteobacteria bacterium]|nr:DNA gyrase inhibitor YacG [Betaproteobacteria bacterium]